MQSILDFKSTIFSTAGYSLILTGVVAMYWLRNRREYSFLALIIGGVGGFLGGMLPQLPLGLAPWPTLVLSTSLILLYNAMAWVAVRLLHGKGSAWWLAGLLLAATMLAYAWAGPLDFSRRIFITSCFLVVMWLLVFWELRGLRVRYPGVGHRVASLLALATAGVAVCRIVHAWHAQATYSQAEALFNLTASLALYWLSFGFTLCLLYLSYEQVLDQLQRRAHHDSLTSLLNHRTFQEQAEAVFLSAVRQQAPLSLLLLDLDHFKNINDRYGHQAGDQVLLELADCLRAEARQSDLLGRCGGEEFAILLPQTNCIEAYKMAERLRRAIAGLKVVVAPGEEVGITASIGLVSEPVQHENLASMFLAADMLLYQAKHKGRNRVEMA